MSYTYEGAIEEQEGGWLVTFTAFPGAIADGDTIAEACANASEVLQLFIATYLDDGRLLPTPEFSNPPRCVFTVEVTDEDIATSRCMTIKQAAAELGLSISRVSQLLTKGALEAYEHNGERLVTIASVNERKANPPAPHRPKKNSNG